MGKRIILVAMIVTAGTAITGFGQGLVNSASAIDPAELASMEQEILSTTVRIEIETWIIYVEGQGYTSFSSNGHGTVMDGRYLLTHNHFDLPLLELLADKANGEFATVTLYTAGGNLLWEGPLTVAGVAFDDSETLLLELVNGEGQGLFESLGVPSAEFGSAEAIPLTEGTTVAQINWDETQAHVQWTEVEALTQRDGVPIVRLSEWLIRGASGGGVFLDGVHIANNWSRSAGGDGANQHSIAALNSVELLAAAE